MRFVHAIKKGLGLPEIARLRWATIAMLYQPVEPKYPCGMAVVFEQPAEPAAPAAAASCSTWLKISLVVPGEDVFVTKLRSGPAPLLTDLRRPGRRDEPPLY